MEVQAHLALEWHGVEEALHEEALATPHAAVHVHAAGNVWPVDQLLDRVGALGLVGSPVIGTTLQGVDRAQLGGIALKAFGGQFGQVSLFDSH